MVFEECWSDDAQHYGKQFEEVVHCGWSFIVDGFSI